MDPEGAVVSRKGSSKNVLYILCAVLTVSCLALGAYVVHDQFFENDGSSVSASHEDSEKMIDMEYASLISENELEEDDDDDDDDDEHKHHRKTNLCLTPTCVITAGKLLQSLNNSVDPCENFYDFACGNWANSQDVPEGTRMIGVFGKLNKLVNKRVTNLINGNTKSEVKAKSVKDVRNFYDACMDVEAIDANGASTVEETIADLGGFPMASKDWKEDNVDVLELSLKLREMGIGTFFEQVVFVDYQEQNKYRMHIDQADMNLGPKTYYTKASLLSRYQTFVYDVAMEMKATESVASKDAKDLVDFEKKLASISAGRYDRMFIDQVYKKYTVETLKYQVTGKLNWKDYFNKQLSKVGKPDVKDDTVVISYAPRKYFENLMSLIESTPKRTLVNYQIFTLIYNSVGHLGSDYQALILKFVGARKKHARSKICEYGVSRALKWSVSRMFVEKYFDSSAKSTAVTMIEDVRNQFIKMLQGEPWMDAASSKVAVEKAKAIKEHIGYPELIMDDDKLDELYSEMEITSDNYLANIYSTWKNSYTKNLMKLDDSHNDDIWNLDVTMVNAFYEPLKNRISFPAAILQVPFYHKDYPKYLNYAGIGFVIGHEITHGFDSSGRRFDKDGKRRDWWSPDVVKAFQKKSQCYVEQYDKFMVKQIGQHVNGKNTLNENIADNGGLKESFGAYRNYVKTVRHGKEEGVLPGLNMTPNQLFFLNTAQAWCSKIYDNRIWKYILSDVHSPGRFRILGSMANSPDFAKAYKCPVGSKMNPAKKCELW